jgi:HSP20 family molecular chaperone IbpA
LDKSSNEDLEVEIAYYRSTISGRRAYIQEMEDEFKREQKEAREYYGTVLAKESTIGDGRLCDAFAKLSL